MDGEHLPKRIVRPRVLAANALEGEVETVADQVVCAAALVDGLLSFPVCAGRNRED
jgi:hypothetical protein